MSRLVICEILGLSVNTLTAVNKSSLHNSRNLQQPIQIKYPTNENIFHIFFHLWNLHQVLNIFYKKMTLVAYVFPKLRLRKT